jgi:hypothetical protein
LYAVEYLLRSQSCLSPFQSRVHNNNLIESHMHRYLSFRGPIHSQVQAVSGLQHNVRMSIQIVFCVKEAFLVRIEFARCNVFEPLIGTPSFKKRGERVESIFAFISVKFLYCIFFKITNSVLCVRVHVLRKKRISSTESTNG